jgi:hypothetical protein
MEPQIFDCLTVCVTGAGAGVDSAWEQKKLEARKMLAVGAARCEAAVPSVQCTLCWAVLISQLMSSQLTFVLLNLVD